MPTPRDDREDETLAQLIYEVAGTRGEGLTYDQLAAKSVDPETGYSPSANLLHRIATGQAVKVNPSLVRAITEGLGLSPERVQRAAMRQFIVGDAGIPAEGDDEVIRVATRGGVTPGDGGGVGDFVRGSRADYPSD